jgi:hypothetical protein
MNAREASLRPAVQTVEAFKTDVAINVIPVSGAQWQRSVVDAELVHLLHEYGAHREKVAANADAERDAIGHRLRPAALEFVSTASDLCERLELLSMLAPQNPAAAAGVNAWRGAVIADMRSVVSAATIGEDVSGSPIWPVLPEVTIDERDVLLDTFGVPASDLVDASGLFSDARLLAAYRLKLPMLQEVCDRILGLIAERPPSVLSGVSCVRDIVTSPSPLMTLTTARQVRRMFLDAFSGDADRTAGVLAETWDQRDREWSTFVRLNDRLRRIESAETQREHDIALLEAYKHMVEGLTRRWAWTLLRLSGLDGRSPSVGQLIEPAVARLGLIGVWLKRSLLVIARNAEAHEDLDFDEDTGRLLVGNSTVEPQALAGFLQELDILQRGWEAGRLATVQDSPSLGAAALGRATKRSQNIAL